MAQKVRIILEDDLDGGPADETVRFGLDGGSRGAATAVKRNPETAAIRKWAKENGHEVSDRGRIHQEIQDAYYAALKKEQA